MRFQSNKTQFTGNYSSHRPKKSFVFSNLPTQYKFSDLGEKNAVLNEVWENFVSIVHYFWILEEKKYLIS